MAELHVIAPTTIPETQKLRVGAYVRVSTDSEDQENSFLTQYDFYSQFRHICVQRKTVMK